MRITALIENTSSSHAFQCEHGLSLYFEAYGKKYLMDMGQSGKFIENALKLGIDLSGVDYAIVSHNHYDHIGGLEEFFKVNFKAQAYIRKEAAEAEYYSQRSEKKLLSRNDILKKYNERIVFTEGITPLGLGVNLLPADTSEERFVCPDKNLFMEKDGALIPDNYRHEQFVTVKTAGGIALINSCSHGGIVNAVQYASNALNAEIEYIVAGLHTMAHGDINALNCSKEYLELLSGALGRHKALKRVWVCHCTGLAAYAYVQKLLGNKVAYLAGGQSIDL